MTDIYGTDIKVNSETKDILFSLSNDFALISDLDNLKQAIIIRLLTAKGELKSHLDYGSDLYKLVGAPQDDTTKATAVSYVYDSLSNEPRIQSIDDVIVDYVTIDSADYLNINVYYTPIEQDVQQNLVINYQI